MKIYTKTGDRGDTGLIGARRVAKSSMAIQVCGDLDEANSLLGVVLMYGLQAKNQMQVTQVQRDLFAVGSVVAAVPDHLTRAQRLPSERVLELEAHIDHLEMHLPPMDAFILPGGVPAAAHLHWARCVVRRAERSFIAMVRTADLGELLHIEMAFLNRLSDLLFVMARFENLRLCGGETKWLPNVT